MPLPRKPAWRKFEDALGYRFHNRNLLETALTHASYHADRNGERIDNQRLEFLGDAVLGLLAAEALYASHTSLDEGGLSMLRSLSTNGKTLAAAARRIGLGEWLRLGRSELLAGGRDRSGALADALEAVLGAVWLDGGLNAARKVFTLLALQPVQPLDDPLDILAANPKGCLQEYAQRAHHSVPVYTLCLKKGPPHLPCYRVRVSVGNSLSAEGEGATKRAAEAAAATNLLKSHDLPAPNKVASK